MTFDLLSFLLGIGTALTVLLAGICGIVAIMPPIKFLHPPAPPMEQSGAALSRRRALTASVN